MALIAQALTTTANLYTHLKIPSDEQTGFQTEAENLINRTSTVILRWLGRGTIIRASATQVYNGDGSDELVLRDWPVTGINSLTVDGETIPAKTGWDNTGYYTDEGDDYSILYLDGYAFSPGRQNVTISASWGYTTGAVQYLELEEACLLLCSYYYSRRTPGVTTDIMEGIAVTYGSDYIPNGVKVLLDPHRKRYDG